MINPFKKHKKKIRLVKRTENVGALGTSYKDTMYEVQGNWKGENKKSPFGVLYDKDGQPLRFDNFEKAFREYIRCLKLYDINGYWKETEILRED